MAEYIGCAYTVKLLEDHCTVKRLPIKMNKIITYIEASYYVWFKKNAKLVMQYM